MTKILANPPMSLCHDAEQRSIVPGKSVEALPIGRKEVLEDPYSPPLSLPPPIVSFLPSLHPSISLPHSRPLSKEAKSVPFKGGGGEPPFFVSSTTLKSEIEGRRNSSPSSSSFSRCGKSRSQRRRRKRKGMAGDINLGRDGKGGKRTGGGGFPWVGFEQGETPKGSGGNK